jgi:hypothetical protein
VVAGESTIPGLVQALAHHLSPPDSNPGNRRSAE